MNNSTEDQIGQTKKNIFLVHPGLFSSYVFFITLGNNTFHEGELNMGMRENARQGGQRNTMPPLQQVSLFRG